MPKQAVVFDINVLIEAVVRGNNSFHSWPSPPPRGGLVASECVGIVNDAREFSLWMSTHVLSNVARVLTASEGYGWAPGRAQDYLTALLDIATASGGGLLEPAIAVVDCVDYEDNRILELASSCGASLVVSSDPHLLEMSPWRGIPIIPPSEFVGRVDAMRRARGRG